MKMSLVFLALLLSTLVLSGCSSTCKKSDKSGSASQNPPVASSSVEVVKPAAAPVAATPSKP